MSKGWLFQEVVLGKPAIGEDLNEKLEFYSLLTIRCIYMFKLMYLKNVGECIYNIMMVKSQNAKNTLEKNWAVSYEVEHAPTLGAYHSTPRINPREMKVYIHTEGCTQMPINR